jgi:hypothetical protein
MSTCCNPLTMWSALMGDGSSDASQLASWSIGTLLLTSTLIGLAILGHMQNAVYTYVSAFCPRAMCCRGPDPPVFCSKYGSSSDESMFYSHLLPIPLFLIFGSDLKAHLDIWNASEPWRIIPIVGAPTVPCLWILCFFNVLTQWVCIEGVYKTTATLGTLTATWATTFRKFMSLVFSLLVFENYFTWNHYAGSSLVFIGSFLYILPSKQVVPATDRKKLQ